MVEVEFIYDFILTYQNRTVKYKAGERLKLAGDDLRMKVFNIQNGITVNVFPVEQSKQTKSKSK